MFRITICGRAPGLPAVRSRMRGVAGQPPARRIAIFGKLVMLGCLSLPVAAQAGPCEDGFKVAGNALSGPRFTATLTVSDLTPDSAVNQMRVLAPSEKLDVLTMDAVNGNMLMELPQSTTHRAIPFVFTATREGSGSRVELLAKFNKGSIVGEKAYRRDMCALLSRLRGGKAGIAVAKAPVAPSQPLKFDALALSQRLAAEARDKPAAIPLRYADKSFTISGKFDYAIQDGAEYRVAFDIPDPGKLLFAPGPGAAQFKVDIHCMMAKDQTAYALSLQKGERIRLTGKFLEYRHSRTTLYLDACRPEKS